MKAAYGFIFFMLFLAGIAFVNLRGMQDTDASRVTAADQLIDAAWRLAYLGEMSAGDDSEVYIQFRSDGQFGGNAGCNRFFGTASFSENLDLGAIGVTRRACPEPANSLEIAFLDALGQATSAARVDDRLAFRNDDGVSVLRFVATSRIAD